MISHVVLHFLFLPNGHIIFTQLNVALLNLGKDQDGHVTSEELKSFILSHIKVKDELLPLLIEQIDVDRDGTISHSELEDFLCTPNPGQIDSS